MKCSYGFFLFSKLFDIYHVADVPYEKMYEELCNMYNDWLIWDSANGKGISAHDSMSMYLSVTERAI